MNRFSQPVRVFEALALPVAIVAGFALRLPGPNVRPLWFDEGYSLYFAGVSPLETAALTAGDIHPPLYYWMLQLWTYLFGWNPYSVRFFSVFLGTLLIAAVVPLARRAGGARAAILASTLLAVSAMAIQYSQEVRMYALLALLSTLSTYALFRLLEGKKAWAPGYVIFTAGALLTQYYAVLLVAAHILTVCFVLLRARNRVSAPAIKLTLASIAVACVPFAGWMLYATPSLLAYVRGKVAFEAYAPLEPLSFLYGIFSTFGGAGPIAALAAAVLGAALITAPLLGTGPRVYRATLSICGLTILAGGWLINVASPFHPQDWERLYLFLLPFVIVAFAVSLLSAGRYLSRRYGMHPALLIAAGAALLVIPNLWRFYDWSSRTPAADPRPMVREISSFGRPDDVVLAVYPWQIGYLRMYATRPLPQMMLVPATAWASNPDQLKRDVDAILASNRRIWLPAYQELGRLLEDELELTLVKNAFPATAHWYGDHRLLLYGAGEGPGGVIAPAKFEDFDLPGGTIYSTPVESGIGLVNVILSWHARAGFPSDASVHLRLVDDKNVTWAQHDLGFNGGRSDFTVGDTELDDHHSLLVPSGTPPGRYRLKLSVTLGNRVLNATRPTGEPLGIEHDIGIVNVAESVSDDYEEALNIQRPLRRDLGSGLELLGSSFDSGPFRPGEPVPVTLYWKALSDSPASRGVTLSSGDSEAVGPPGGGYATRDWRKGELVRDIRTVVVPNVDLSSAPVALAVDDTKVALGAIDISPRTAVLAPPSTSLPGGEFANGIRLAGANFLSNGRAVTLDQLPRDFQVQLVWQSDRAQKQDLSVFLHVVGNDGRPVAQHDGRPVDGSAPVPGWRIGEFLSDVHAIHIPDAVPPGEYQLIAGLYPPPNGARAQVSSGAATPAKDALIIAQIRIR